MVTLGLLAGVAGLWVYSAMRQQRQEENTPPPTGRRRTRRQSSTNSEFMSLGSEAAAAAAAVGRHNTTLRRTGTIRRPRRQTTGSLNGTSSATQLTADPPQPTVSDINDVSEPTALSSRASQASRQHMDSDSESEEETGADKEMRLLALLCAISEDQSRRAGVVHRGMTCNNCSEVPIRGVPIQVCAMCRLRPVRGM
ncbi:hypothetical protein DL89DRAFT_1863 [Linderina pennispora]|uniref:Uncharacterized protein n=1 Tax=Linderina pennispora TaxID=61395 RepID=A0A1Y1WJJ0_9FUNG|nr:uncharacterized protein DL89DRAFT_1863 [Linderina pennispora]ORX73653.1 hypothetical protein DL89DRAFT_1863 [Linderina pennispora]